MACSSSALNSLKRLPPIRIKFLHNIKDFQWPWAHNLTHDLTFAHPTLNILSSCLFNSDTKTSSSLSFCHLKHLSTSHSLPFSYLNITSSKSISNSSPSAAHPEYIFTMLFSIKTYEGCKYISIFICLINYCPLFPLDWTSFGFCHCCIPSFLARHMVGVQ